MGTARRIGMTAIMRRTAGRILAAGFHVEEASARVAP